MKVVKYCVGISYSTIIFTWLVTYIGNNDLIISFTNITLTILYIKFLNKFILETIILQCSKIVVLFI